MYFCNFFNGINRETPPEGGVPSYHAIYLKIIEKPLRKRS